MTFHLWTFSAGSTVLQDKVFAQFEMHNFILAFILVSLIQSLLQLGFVSSEPFHPSIFFTRRNLPEVLKYLVHLSLSLTPLGGCLLLIRSEGPPLPDEVIQHQNACMNFRKSS